MYECLSGSPPFAANSAMEIMYKHMQEEPPKLEAQAQPESLRQLAHLIDRCLRKDPLERPESVKSIASQLEEIFKDDIDMEEFFAPDSKKSIWAWKEIAAALVACTLLACLVFIGFRLIRPQRESATIRIRALSTSGEQHKLEALKSEFRKLEIRLKSKSAEVDKEKGLEGLVDKAIEISKFETWSRKDGIGTLSAAMSYCDSRNPHDLLLKAKLLEERANDESSQNEQDCENDYVEALRLIRLATRGKSSDQEVALYKSLIGYHLSKYDFLKAKQIFLKLEKIWNEKGVQKTAEGQDNALEQSKSILGRRGAFGIFVDDSKKRFAACDFALEVSAFMMSRGERKNARAYAQQCVHSLTDNKGDMPKGDRRFNAMAARAHKMLAELQVEDGDLKDAKYHMAEAERLSH